jgi:hypothetical protein
MMGGAAGELGGDVDSCLQVDASDGAPEPLDEEAAGPADAAADVQHCVVGVGAHRRATVSAIQQGILNAPRFWQSRSRSDSSDERTR